MDWVFKAKVLRVENERTVDVSFDLGFNIKYRNTIVLTGYDVADGYKREATNCLILLIGGNRLFIKIEKEKGILFAKVYLHYIVNMSSIQEVVLDKNLPCVNKIMSRMSSDNYDNDTLKKLLPANDRIVK